MQVQIETEGPVRRRVRVTVPVHRVKKAFDAAYRAMARRVNVPGFRKGKVPLGLVRQRYGKQITADVTQELVGEGWRHVLDEHDLVPLTEPDLDLDCAAKPDADLHLAFSVEVLPEIELAPFDALEVEQVAWQIPEARVDDELEHFAETVTAPEDIEDRKIAEEGDLVTLDFEGRVEGELFDGGKGEDFSLELGSGQFLPGFEQQVIGREIGQDFEVQIAFPERFKPTKLAGKPVVFACTLKRLQRKITVPIDDELAKRLGEESLEALRGSLRERMEAHWKEAATSAAKRALRDQLAEQYDFEVPPSMLEGAVAEERRQQLIGLMGGGVTYEEATAQLEDRGLELQKAATRAIRVDLVLDHIARVNDLEVGEREVQDVVETLARQMGPEARQRYRQAGPRAMIRARLRREKALEFILPGAKVSEPERDIPEHEH